MSLLNNRTLKVSRGGDVRKEKSKEKNSNVCIG